ncbi:MAG: hypothetical protein KIS92_15795 [Planctomycetota bacterium]|nr:hypothetical protein [Planctomycetota bacterium]
MTPVAMPAIAQPAEELDGAFNDLAGVTDLRSAQDHIHRGDTSKLLATINRTAGFSANSAKEEREHLELLKSTAMIRLRKQPWYHNGKYLMIAGTLSVAALGLITMIVVMLTGR